MNSWYSVMFGILDHVANEPWNDSNVIFAKLVDTMQYLAFKTMLQ